MITQTVSTGWGIRDKEHGGYYVQDEEGAWVCWGVRAECREG